MIHALKIKAKYLSEIMSGDKTFEVRKNDRDFRVEDFIGFNEVNEKGYYTGASQLVRINYILSDSEYCKDGYVILGIEKHKIVAEA